MAVVNDNDDDKTAIQATLDSKQIHMKILTKIISIAFLSLISVVAIAQEAAMTMGRPKVGLVLSGGGAKGAAHIGEIGRAHV